MMSSLRVLSIRRSRITIIKTVNFSHFDSAALHCTRSRESFEGLRVLLQKESHRETAGPSAIQTATNFNNHYSLHPFRI